MIPSDRNGWIDVLRAASALAVVLFHFNCVPMIVPTDWPSRTWHALWTHGYWGVGVFFALSGYCLFPGWSRASGCIDFVRRRLWRIFPPYWCSLLLIVLMAVAAKLLTGVNDVAALPQTLATVMATVLLLTNPFTTIATVNWVYWTLTCLIACYLLMSLALLAPGAARIRFLAALHLTLCALAVAFPSVATGPWFFLKFWPVFGCGLALAVHDQHRSAGRVMLLASLLSAVWLIGQGSDKSHLLAVGVVTAALLAGSRKLSFPAGLRPLAWVGKISYSLYLVHVPIGIYGLLRFFPEGSARSFAHLGNQLVLLAATMAVAWLFYLVAERPFLPPARSPASA